MLNLRITIIIIAFTLTGCNTLPERQTDSAVVTADPIAAAGSLTSATDKTSAQKQTTTISLVETRAADVSKPPAYEDIWLRIRDKLSLDHHIDKRSVKAKLAWYARHQDYLDRVAERARPYIYHIVEELEKRNMPVELALLPIVESAYHPFAYSRSHASGIWQFIPGTGRNYGLKQNWWYDGRRDIVAATDAALRYLDKLNKEFNGNWLHALAAYNTGERKVARAISRNKKAHKLTDFWSLRLPRETRGYVPSLLAVAELLAKPEQYAVKWQTIDNKPYFTEIDVQGQLDLATAAKLADISMDEIYTLNPAFNRWATDPDGPHNLLIPLAKGPSFVTQLAALPDAERISWKRHIIKRGENLGQIARNYHTSVSALKQTNNLRSNLIREGRSLLIPSSLHPLKHYSLSLDSRRYRGLKKSASGTNYVYTIRRGDTLWDIGRQYGVSIKQLCAWNGINSRSVLRPGKKLKLRLASNEKNTVKAIPASYDNSKASVVNYTVKKGDSLWRIARRFKVTVKQLLAWNNLSKSKHLKPGQQLLVQDAQNNISGV
jgi:peptidoglycan lytic transglycosylase D